MQPSTSPSPEDSEEPAELARFRAEWKAELNRRRQQRNAEPSASSSAAAASVTELQSSQHPATPPATIAQLASKSLPPSAASPPKKSIPSSHPLLTGAVSGPTTVSPGLGSALAIYRRAVQHEQRSELDEALLLYRQAFRLDPNVDRAYHREEMLASVLSAQTAAARKFTVNAPVPEEVEYLAEIMQKSLAVKPLPSGNAVVTGTLASLVSKFPENLKFEPENELEPVHISILPDEIFIMVIRKLDPTSIERFARVNKKARVLTLDSIIWRDLVSTTYRIPQIPDLESMVPVITNYLSDYRQVFINHPRIRMDGVYIAICHYVRPGLSENSWINISHLITYHRYLRFYANGTVLSLLANEEHSPQQVIPLLKPTLRMKGLFVGNWRLVGTLVELSNLIDASGRYLDPQISSSTHHQSTSTPSPNTRYVFAMSLRLKSRPVGRWNRMDIESYDSVNLGTGDVTPVALKHERPFWFSKVRSYGSQI